MAKTRRGGTMKFKDWYEANESKIKEIARFSNNPIVLMEFAWDERGKLTNWKKIVNQNRDIEILALLAEQKLNMVSMAIGNTQLPIQDILPNLSITTA